MAMPSNVKKYLDKYWDIYQVGTLPPSGALGMNQINGEFGRGTGLANYRGTQWWTDTYGQTGTFSTTGLGYNQFYGKRASSPPPPYFLSATLHSVSKGGFPAEVGYAAGIYGSLSPANFTTGQFVRVISEMPFGGKNTFTIKIDGSPTNWNVFTMDGVTQIGRGSFTYTDQYGWQIYVGFVLGNNADYHVTFT